jgi:2-dehydro-3-deoxygluconokinase
MNRKQRVVVFGECMLELQGQAFGAMRQTFGGDTLNTAVYLSRLLAATHGWAVHYATGLGTDALSDGLMQRWLAEGLEVDLVRRIDGRLPGLYLIETDARGERRFSYWRDHSAARAYFDLPPEELTPLERLADAQDVAALYFSGISLAILAPVARKRLLALAAQMRDRGARVVFDNNYRPRLWPDNAEARLAYERAWALADIGLATAEDHQALMGLSDEAATLVSLAALPTPELVVKRGAADTLWRGRPGANWNAAPTVPVPAVVDTTAAGDAFAAAYLAGRLLGRPAGHAAAAGNRLAARVIAHPGALIPLAAMADLVSASVAGSQ